MLVLLYVLDALRADHLGCYGYRRDTSPSIDRLAAEGIVFDNCFTSSTWTRPVAATLLSGAYPSVHGACGRRDGFDSNLARMPEVFRESGHRTLGVTAMGNLAGELGFARGFDQYVDLFSAPSIVARRTVCKARKEGLPVSPRRRIGLPLAEDINEALFPWIAEHRASDTFCFAWSIETHVPYAAPARFRRFSSLDPVRPYAGQRRDIRSADRADRERIINLYDDEIVYSDHCIGELVAYLKEHRLYDDSLIVITADHGDAFFEHGTYAHDHAPYEELVHVPLIMKLPYSRHSGRRVRALVELVDVFPTLVSVTGRSLPEAARCFLQGHDLMPVVEGNVRQVRRWAFSETQSLPFKNGYQSVRTGRWKYIRRRSPPRTIRTLLNTLLYIARRRMLIEVLRHRRHFLRRQYAVPEQMLFDLRYDPAEKRNLVAERPRTVAHLSRVLGQWQGRNTELAARAGSLGTPFGDGELLRRHLAELGYL